MSATLLAGGPAVEQLAALAIARRAAAGGSLWCAVPAGGPRFGLPGARDLPWAGLVASLRGAVRSGDVVLLHGSDADDTGTDVTAAEVLRRAPAWGVTTVWLGVGDRPQDGAADYLIRADDIPALVTRCLDLLAGDPAFLAPPPDCDGPVCITCSDEGRLAEVVDVDGTTAWVRTASGVEEADVTLVGAVQPFDLLVLHAGTALTRLGGRTL